MNKPEYSEALRIAASPTSLHEWSDLGVFYGFGLPDFAPVGVTVRQVAALIRWQAWRFDGTWDTVALEELRNLGRKRFMILPN